MGNWNANLQIPASTGGQGPAVGGRRGRAVGLAALALVGLNLAARAQAPAPGRTSGGLASPSDEQSYRKEFVFGINFNTQGALIGGVSVRSARVLDERWLRFWSLEGVMLKNSKEQRVGTNYGGSIVYGKVNNAFALRPSVGMQRILFRKAPDSGVQVNALLSAGPSLGILLPYYITYDRTPAGQRSDPQYYQDEPFDPTVQRDEGLIVDRASLLAGVGKTHFVPGAHLRAALSFEYGRYRDAVAGLETGFLLEAYTKRLVILNPDPFTPDASLNKQFFPSVYLTLYFGHRS